MPQYMLLHFQCATLAIEISEDSWVICIPGCIKKFIFCTSWVALQHKEMGWTNPLFLHIARKLEVFVAAVQYLFDLCGEEIGAYCWHITSALQLSLCHLVRCVLLQSAVSVVWRREVRWCVCDGWCMGNTVSGTAWCYLGEWSLSLWITMPLHSCGILLVSHHCAVEVCIQSCCVIQGLKEVYIWASHFKTDWVCIYLFIYLFICFQLSEALQLQEWHNVLQILTALWIQKNRRIITYLHVYIKVKITKINDCSKHQSCSS